MVLLGVGNEEMVIVYKWCTQNGVPLENLPECSSEYWFTPEVRLGTEGANRHVSFSNTQENVMRFQGLQLKANVSLGSPRNRGKKQRETRTF